MATKYWKESYSSYEGMHAVNVLQGMCMCKNENVKSGKTGLLYHWQAYIINIVLIWFFYSYESDRFYGICFHDILLNNGFENMFVLHM